MIAFWTIFFSSEVVWYKKGRKRVYFCFSGTLLEQVWNLRGTSVELLGLIVRVLCDILELAWNLRGTLGGGWVFFWGGQILTSSNPHILKSLKGKKNTIE